VVVELHRESAAKPSTKAWAISRRAQRAHRLASERAAAAAAATPTGSTNRREGMIADAR
jgi:hypothetical protein